MCSYVIIVPVGKVRYFQLHTCQARHMSILVHDVIYTITMKFIMESLIRIQKMHSVFIQLWSFVEGLYLK